MAIAQNSVCAPAYADLSQSNASPSAVEPAFYQGNQAGTSFVSADMVRTIVPPTSVSSRRRLGHEILEPEKLARMEFRKAADLFVEANRHRLRKKAFCNYEQHAKFLGKFFGEVKLENIHIGHILAYQEQRSANTGNHWKKPAGPSCINHEMSFLRGLLRVAGQWGRIADHYQPLKMPTSAKQKVMSDIEKRRFYTVASSKPEWQLCCCIAIITNNTSCSGTELRNLQLKDVVLDGEYPRITVNGETAKNYYRERTVNLNLAATDAMRICVERARVLGSHLPDHYVFPWRQGRGKFDPSRPGSQAWIRIKWEKLRDAAGLPWLTPHCLRHQCITELCEAGVAPEMIKKIAGHVTDKMLDHYSHQRFEQQAAALEKLATKSHPPTAVSQPASQGQSLSNSCPHCGVSCAPGMAFCPNGDILDEDRARKARPWLFRGEAA